jgi:hypothetical protein
MSTVYTYNYDSDYHPPMPVVELSIGLPLSDTVVELQAIVDSGADGTMIPVRHLQQVGARRSRKAMMRGVTGVAALVDLYAVAVRLGSYRQGFVEVVGVVDNDETIIGRDILNHLSVTLNGPALAVEVY